MVLPVGILVHGFVEQISFGANSLFWLVSGIVVSIGVAVAADVLVDYVYRPQVVVDGVSTVDRGAEQVRVARVRNEGRRATTHCSAVLTVQSVEPASVLSATVDDEREPLNTYPVEDRVFATISWATPEPSAKRHLNPGETALLRLYKRDDRGRLVLPSEMGWELPAAVLSGAAAPYDATLRVSSEKATDFEMEVRLE